MVPVGRYVLSVSQDAKNPKDVREPSGFPGKDHQKPCLQAPFSTTLYDTVTRGG